ncbi:MAG TPA: thioredoxin domain-containing protein, partial [Pyrinomonadaceae bacterium]
TVAFAIASGDKTSPRNGTTNGNRNTAAVAPTIPPNAPAGAQPPNVLGSPTATVTVEEFADFQCPTCAQVHTMMKNIQSTYGSRIKFVYRNFPLTQIHKNAYEAAVASEAAGQQGRFWDMQNQLYTSQPAWSNSSDARTVFAEYAGKIGLDVEKFKTDMLAMTTKSRVDADIARARALGVNSTPTLYINGKTVPFEQMKLETLRAIIDAELQKGGTAQATQTAPATGTAAGNAGGATTNEAGGSAANSPNKR